MKEGAGYLAENENVLQPTADILFAYLRDVIYDPLHASLSIEQLPPEFQDFGKGLELFSNYVLETTALAKELANGNLNSKLPPSGNEIAAPLKMLHASLKHLTWQAQQVAKGDYQQRVKFMGDFAEAFNNMIKQLEEQRIINLAEKSQLELYVHLMLANYPDPILLFNQQGQLAYASDSYLRCSGFADIGQILNQPLRQLFATVLEEQTLQSMEELFTLALEENCAAEMAQDIDFGDTGAIRHYQIQLTPMFDAEGHNQGVLLLMYDSTEIVQARRESEHARELAEQSSRAKSDFLARMSHEMRTPMNAIIGMTNIAKDSDDPDKQAYCLERIDNASRHLLGVINDILDMSKIEADKFDLSLAEFSFMEMLNSALDVVNFRIEEKKQQLSLHIDPAIPAMLIGDEHRLAQVITNLLTNAVKFTPEQGSIDLRAELQSKEGPIYTLRMEITDSGIGIAAEQQDKLFHSFEQADGSIARKFGGTGLGLAISKRIVELMGGEIWVESELGKGAKFIFTLQAEAMQSKAAESDEKAGEAESAEFSFNDKTALLAEDVEINREIIQTVLGDTGMAIECAENGREAVEMFAAAPGRYDIVLMDIHMPEVDGWEATRRIRALNIPEGQTVPIMAMTANVFQEDIEKCLNAGMNDHIGKPIDFEELFNKLKKHLR